MWALHTHTHTSEEIDHMVTYIKVRQNLKTFNLHQKFVGFGSLRQVDFRG